MANQKTPTTDTVEDVTVEKIILSGSPFVSAILGSGAYRISAASTPLFFRDPIISGEMVPPSVLTCEAQSFTSSPRATITYQWKRDTVNVDEETNSTFTTITSDIGVDITCEVTITNASGSDNVLSNVFTPEGIVEGYVYELDVYTINGLNSIGRIDVNDLDLFIITGMPHDDKIDVVLGVVQMITGMSNEDKIDCNECDGYIVTGLQSDMQIDVAEIDTYVVFQPSFLTPLDVLNGDAENTDMSDWTMDFGNVTSVTTAPGYGIDDHRTGRFFKGDDLGQGVDSQMSQVMLVDSGDEVAIDEGKSYAYARFKLYAERHYDSLTITLTALNAADGVLGTKAIGPIFHPNEGAASHRGWMALSMQDDPLSLPTLTRKIKITILFEASASGSPANTVYTDNIHVDLMQIA